MSPAINISMLRLGLHPPSPKRNEQMNGSTTNKQTILLIMNHQVKVGVQELGTLHKS